MLLHAPLAAGMDEGVPALLGHKYGWSRAAGERAPARCTEILATLSGELRRQRERGSPYFVGEQISAVDIYWATFAAMLEPLDAELCPMGAGMRAAYTLVDPAVRKAADPLLLEHRDRIYREHLTLPLDF
jgi:glutathione S-transferase